MKKFVSALFTTALVLAAAMPAQAAQINVPATRPSELVATGTLRAVMSTEDGPNDSALQQFVIDDGTNVVPVPDSVEVNATVGDAVSMNSQAVTTSTESGDSRATGLAVPAQTSQRHLLVVPLTWTGMDFTAARLSALSSTLSQLDTWWSTTSGGVEDLSIQSLSAVSIAEPKDCDTATYDGLKAVRTAAAASQFSGWFTNIAVIMPQVNNSAICRWGGLGYMPGDAVWINTITLKVFAHELGHNLGLPHANSCLATFTVSLIDKCKHYEYGDYLDPMGDGRGDSVTYNPAYMAMIGWMPASQWTQWDGTRPVTYALAPSSSTAGGLRAVKVDARGSLLQDAPGEYWIYYNQSTTSPGNTGVYMSLVPTKEHIKRGVDIPESASAGPGLFTWLCDISPTGVPDGSSSFALNTPWLDPLGRFTITVSSTGATATVTIAPNGKAPVAPTNVSASVDIDSFSTATGAVKVSWNVSRPAASAALGEPVVVEAIVDGTSSSCSAPVFAGSCLISNVPRGKALSVTTVARNYTAVSPAAQQAVPAVPLTAPYGKMNVSHSGRTTTVQFALVSDGGSPVTIVDKVELSNGTRCEMVNWQCTFLNLPANTSYTAKFSLANSTGSRVVSVDFLKPMQAPSRPGYSTVKTTSGYQLIVTPDPIDTFNISSLGFGCGPDLASATTLNWSRESGRAVLDVPASEAKSNCWVAGQNSLGRYAVEIIWGYNFPGPSDRSDLTEGEFFLEVKVIRSKNRKAARVTWRAVDTVTGETRRTGLSPVVSRIGGRVCRIVSVNSCVVSGLSKSKRYAVTVRLVGVGKSTAVIK